MLTLFGETEAQDNERGEETCGRGERCEATQDNILLWWPLFHMSCEERTGDLTGLFAKAHGVCREKLHFRTVHQEEN